MPDNGPVIITGIVERYWAPEETRPGRLVLRADDRGDSRPEDMVRTRNQSQA